MGSDPISAFDRDLAAFARNPSSRQWVLPTLAPPSLIGGAMNRSTLLFFPLWFFAATTPAGSSRDTEILAQAHSYQMEFRAGNHDVVKPLVKTLEDAVAQSPNNAELWEAMGGAYMSQQGSMYGGTLD